MDRDDEDFGEGFIAESHPLRPTHLSVPGSGRPDSRAPSISSSVSDLDVPIYTRETTIPVSAGKVSTRCPHANSNYNNKMFLILLTSFYLLRGYIFLLHTDLCIMYIINIINIKYDVKGIK